MKRLTVVSMASMFMLLAFMIGTASADQMYLTATGQKSGLIRGGVAVKGLEGWMSALAVDQSVISPRDPQSGLPTGQRQHKPLMVQLRLDRAFPMLLNVMVNNENLTTVELRAYRNILKSGVPVPTHLYTIKLLNANIASSRVQNPEPGKTTATDPSTIQEITFTYQQIQWTWVQGGITAIDDWESPVN